MKKTHCWRDRAETVLVEVASPEATVRVKGRRVREREAMLMILGIGASILLDRNQSVTVKLIAQYARSSVTT